jgi:predicted RNase H-like HicB family nuclease
MMKMEIRLTQDARGTYRAWCPCLPGCVSAGRTKEEARQKMEVAIRGYLASMDVALPEDSAELVAVE